jgi:glucose/arabinose dehydrogenase
VTVRRRRERQGGASVRLHVVSAAAPTSAETMRLASAARRLVLLAFAAALLALVPRAVLGQQSVIEQVGSVQTEAGAVAVQDVVGGLVHPWALAFLPDGRMLVTERPGRLRLLRPGAGGEPAVVKGTPEVFAQGQGGLLDVALHPNFAVNRLVYLAFAEPGDDGGASTALGRGRLADDGRRIDGFEVIFRQAPKVGGPNHFGGRIVFTDGGHLFLTLGERFKFDPAQDLSNHLGTVVRLNLDGRPAPGNPFTGEPEAEDAIWSYGHRNIEAAALHPETGALWVAEMGPLGGDELNRTEAGRNYGWPVVSWGKNYDGSPIPDPPMHPEFADAVTQWTPVIAPSGMAFYTGDVYAAWQGSALIGGLMTNGLVRVEIDGAEATDEERIPLGARIRDVVEGPDGLVYVLTDAQDGHVWRLAPLKAGR